MNVFLISSNKKIGSQLIRRQRLRQYYYGSANIIAKKITLLSSSSSSTTLSSFWYPTISSSASSLPGVESSTSFNKPINQIISTRRYFSSQQQQDDDKNNNNDDPTSSSTQQQQQQQQLSGEFDHLPPLESANPDRIRGIQVNPESIGYNVLPGNLVYKYYKFTGNTRKVPLELTHGYFWMIKDLQKTNNKPTLSNDVLIPKEDRQLFPTLHGLATLNNEKVDLPYFFINKHNKDPNSQNNCTLVSISFRDSGFKNISTWTKPFDDVFIVNSNNNIQSYTISITERGSLSILKGFLANVMKNNTPPNEYDTTLLYFNGWGKTDVDEFRDVLRMHNIMTNYVFLLDNLGCIRFAGSGVASDEDVSRLIRFTKELTTESSKSNNTNSKTKINKNNNRKKRGGTKSR